jgi:hypothetical protein
MKKMFLFLLCVQSSLVLFSQNCTPDIKKPTAVCYQGLAVAALPATASAEVFATQLDAGSYDNCTTHAALKFRIQNTFLGSPNTSVKPDTLPEKITVYCKGLVLVRLWAGDAAGNWASCDTYIDVQYPWQGAPGSVPCPINSATLDLSKGGHKFFGCATNPQGAAICGDISINIQPKGTIFFPPLPGMKLSYSQNIRGCYGLDSLPLFLQYSKGDTTNVLNVSFSEKILSSSINNGISTFDLVLISKDILGKQPFTEWWQTVAADVNRSGAVTTADLVELRKVILGIITTFSNNSSVRTFASDKKAPLNLGAGKLPKPTTQFQYYPTRDSMQTNFIVVKIGDVNNSTLSCAAPPPAAPRSTKFLTLENQSLAAHQKTTIALTLSQVETLLGCQFDLKYNDKILTINGVRSNLPNFSEENFALINGALRLSWFDVEAIKSSAIRPTFYIEVTAETETVLSDALYLATKDSDLNPEMYDEQLTISNLTLRFERNTTFDKTFFASTIQPNPLTNNGLVKFNLPSPDAISFRIFDVTGKQIFTQTNNYSEGLQQIELEKTIFPSSGLYFYELSTSFGKAVGKVVVE